VASHCARVLYILLVFGIEVVYIYIFWDVGKHGWEYYELI
jgi:hypothetical protein